MRTGLKYWLQRGFIPVEASAFKNITTESIDDSRYIRTMIETRRGFKREANRNNLTIREYYRSIRDWYVKRGFTDNQSDLVLRGNAQRRNKARRIAFDFFSAYKEKYAIRDTSGKLTETPRKKTKVRKKPITKKGNINQLIAKDRDEIKYLRFRLQFEKSDRWKEDYRTRIKRHQDRIARLKAQAK